MNDLIDAKDFIKKIHTQGYHQGINAARAEIIAVQQRYSTLNAQEYCRFDALKILDERLTKLIEVNNE